MPLNHPVYHKDETVLCFHHDILYEAKIIALRLSDPEDRKSPYEYRVHYKGWKHTYVTLTLTASTQYKVRSVDSIAGANIQMFILPCWTRILEFPLYI